MKNNHSPAAEENRILWGRLKDKLKRQMAKTTFEEKVRYLEKRKEKPSYIHD